MDRKIRVLRWQNRTEGSTFDPDHPSLFLRPVTASISGGVIHQHHLGSRAVRVPLKDWALCEGQADHDGSERGGDARVHSHPQTPASRPSSSHSLSIGSLFIYTHERGHYAAFPWERVGDSGEGGCQMRAKVPVRSRLPVSNSSIRRPRFHSESRRLKRTHCRILSCPTTNDLFSRSPTSTE